MKRQGKSSDLAVVGKVHDFLVLLFEETGRMPRQLRFGLGQRMEESGLSVLMGLVEACYDAGGRETHLVQVNLEIEKLRHLNRLAVALKALASRKSNRQLDELEEIGRMVGGWLRSTRHRNNGMTPAIDRDV